MCATYDYSQENEKFITFRKKELKQYGTSGIVIDILPNMYADLQTESQENWILLNSK